MTQSDPELRWHKIPKSEVLNVDWVNSDVRPTWKSYGRAFRLISEGRQLRIEEAAELNYYFLIPFMLVIVCVVVYGIWSLAEPSWKVTLTLFFVGFEVLLLGLLRVVSQHKVRNRHQFTVDLERGVIELPRLNISLPLQSIDRIQWIQGRIGLEKRGTGVELYVLVRSGHGPLERFFVMESPDRLQIQKLARFCNLPVEERILPGNEHVEIELKRSDRPFGESEIA